MANTEQMIIFDIGNEKFGIRITRVHEIIRMKEITELPDTSEYFAGIINLRGDIISVIDLRRRFGVKSREDTDETRIIVVGFKGQDVGLIVDAVSEVLHIDPADIDDPPQSMVSIKNNYLIGIAKSEDDMINILDLDNLLESKEDIKIEK
ncbi:chemotaxis signal transduction protein [Halobacteroides halobius DSM 5150]|uniref:Chemotaxis signal transduction protein n=1 Tax=Halobacteroides halobius (strain ATCC 35273 / DSM 5150 / MD-1) TaxID=748449 RepID=L0K9C6_HALHC|nr:chemotaxis protein CheW [Halobacteroides halobius]AGB40959.1 chemotaxis signal transduction protein [Halobacteroides halobius DSM 5150]